MTTLLLEPTGRVDARRGRLAPPRVLERALGRVLGARFRPPAENGRRVNVFNEDDGPDGSTAGPWRGRERPRFGAAGAAQNLLSLAALGGRSRPRQHGPRPQTSTREDNDEVQNPEAMQTDQGAHR